MTMCSIVRLACVLSNGDVVLLNQPSSTSNFTGKLHRRTRMLLSNTLTSGSLRINVFNFSFKNLNNPPWAAQMMGSAVSSSATKFLYSISFYIAPWFRTLMPGARAPTDIRFSRSSYYYALGTRLIRRPLFRPGSQPKSSASSSLSLSRSLNSKSSLFFTISSAKSTNWYV